MKPATSHCCLLVSFISASCAHGSPPGFSSGKSWSFPLVDPLENGTLVTPVFINDRGPYLFAIDPDARVSIIDGDVAQTVFGENLDLYNVDDDAVMAASGKTHNPDYAAVLNFRIGSLTVSGQVAEVTDVGFESVDGRPIRGVLGRNILADSLVFGFDRDLGMGYLSTQEAFVPPANASTIGYSVLHSDSIGGMGVERHIAPAIIDGKKFNMHLALNEGAGQLRRSFWDGLQLKIAAVDAVSFDDTGVASIKKEATVAHAVAVGATVAEGVVVFPYQDKRWDEDAIDGSLGLDFFRRFIVWANWDAKKIYVSPRDVSIDHTMDRIARWSIAEFTRCPDVACVAIALTNDDPAQPPKLTVTRDDTAPHFDFEIVIAVTSAPGGAALPPMIVNLPYFADRVERVLDSHYIGATFAVKDMSPFIHPCDDSGGCITTMPTGPVRLTRTQ